MSRARIAIVLNTIGLGGVPVAALQLLRHLPAACYDTSVFVLKHADTDSKARVERRTRFESIGAHVHIAERTDELGVVAELTEWLAARRIDLLHTHSFRPNLYGRLAGVLHRPRGLKVIAHYHNQYDNKWDRDPATLTLEQQLAEHSDAMVAVSKSVRRHVAERLQVDKARIELVSNGVEVRHFQGVDREQARRAFNVDPGQITVGLVGRICEQKGQEDLVEAALDLCQTNRRALFLMAGTIEDRGLKDRLVQRIEGAGRAHQIRFIGHVIDMPTLYAAIDMLVAPSRWEGFGLMLIEAMAAGLPVVASRVGAIPEVVSEGETALLVPPHHPDALAAALADLMRHPERRAQLGQAGQRRAERFSWQRAGEQLDNLYGALLATR